MAVAQLWNYAHVLLNHEYISARAAQNWDGRSSLAVLRPARARTARASPLLSLHNPVARAARALAGRYTVRACQTSKTRVRARLDIRTERLARARAARAKCSLAGLTMCEQASRAAREGLYWFSKRRL